MPFNKYHIDFRKLVIWLLPTPLRKPSAIALLTAMVGPIVKLYNGFMAFRQSVIYKLTITPQVCYLEKALNDRYDNAQRRIAINDAQQYAYLYLYLKIENKPVYLFLKNENKPRYIYTQAETSRFGVDFIIVIPSAVSFNQNELVALVNSYKLASKKFKVKVV